MSEQRKSRRIRRDAIQVEWIEGTPVQAQIHDFSLGGACVMAPLEIASGECLDLLLVETFTGKSQQMRARVQWSDGQHRGLQWVDLDASGDRWVRSLIGFWLGEAEANRT
jgi:hypothetical protein